jgi:hypothetical protein
MTMRVVRLLSLFGFAVLLAVGVPGSPAAGDDKPKADPPAKEKDKAERELHIVGIASGFTESDGKIHGAKALVTVKRPGKQVTLVLVTGEAVTWEVTIDKDTILEKVILGGRERAAVKGLPEKTEVKELYRGGANPQLPEFAYRIDSLPFRSLVDAVDRYAGLPVASFTAAGRADVALPVVVDRVQADERFSPDWPTPVPAAKLPKLTFKANHYVAGDRFGSTGSYGEFTLTGPVAKSLNPLPDRVSRVTYDPNSKKHYGISDHGVVVIDLEKQDVTKLDMGLDVPKLSWPADLTFDTKRDRLLLVSSGGGGYLYAYDTKKDKWEALVKRAPAAVFTYHPKDDMLYGMKGDGAGELLHINEKGAVVKTVKLDGAIVPGLLGLGPGVTGVQLVPADDKLILLIAPAGLRPSEDAAPKWSYMYLIDPKTGKAQLTWKDK